MRLNVFLTPVLLSFLAAGGLIADEKIIMDGDRIVIQGDLSAGEREAQREYREHRIKKAKDLAVIEERHARNLEEQDAERERAREIEQWKEERAERRKERAERSYYRALSS